MIGNGHLITWNAQNHFFESGCVAIDGQVVKQVGMTEDLKQAYPEATLIDAKGGMIMLGFTSMYNHICSTFTRGLNLTNYHPKNFMDILVDQQWRIGRTPALKDTYRNGKVAYLDSIRNGVTTIFDHHAGYREIIGGLTQLSNAVDELGIRTCLCYEVFGRGGEQKMREIVQESAAFTKASSSRKDDMQRAMMGMYAAFTSSDASLELCTASTPDEIGYYTHITEDLVDVHDSLKKYGKPIANRLSNLKILGKQTIANHCIHIGPHEMELLRETDTTVVTNPEPNMGNATGCPPAIRMFNEHGTLMGLGTGGYMNDMTGFYRAGNVIHKHHLVDPNAVWAEVPAMPFDNNPQMTNRYSKVKLGVLEPDAAAGIVVVDCRGSTPVTKENYNMHTLLGMNGRMVTDTVISGETWVRNRRVQGIDEEKAWHDVQT